MSQHSIKEKKSLYKKWWFWTIIAIIGVILTAYIYIKTIEVENDDEELQIESNDIGDEGISLFEFNAIEVGKTDILALKGLIGYTDKNFDKIVSEVEEPIYKDDENGNTHIYYKQKYVGENGEGYAIITIERYLDDFIVIEKENYGLK